MTDKEQAMMAKDYLLSIDSIDGLIQTLCDNVSTLRSGLYYRNQNLEEDKVQTSGAGDVLASTFAKILEFEKKINQKIDDLVSLKWTVFEQINLIPEFNQRTVLISRYMSMKEWKTIAEDFEQSLQGVYELHGKALLSFFKYNADFLIQNRGKWTKIE